MSDLNKLKVVDFTCGRYDSDDVNTDIPFTESFEKTRTIQQANVVLAAYMNRNYKDMQDKANRDEIPTKVSELDNDVGYITNANIPTKTSDLDNDSGFITKDVNNLTNYTTTTDLNNDLNNINNDISNIKSAIDYKSINYMGDVTVESIKSKNMLNPNSLMNGTVSSSDGTYSYVNYVVVSGYIPVKANKSYTIKLNNITNNQFLFRIVLYTTGKVYSSTLYSGSEVTQKTFTPTINGYVKICFGMDSFSVLSSTNIIQTNPQMEEGSTATSYTPYENLDTGEVVLYEGKSNTGLILSDIASNYNYIEIYYSNNAGGLNGSTRFKPYDLVRTTLELTNVTNTATNQNTQLFYKVVSISGTTLTVDQNRGIYMSSALADYSTASITSSSDNIIYIRKIVGYK